MAGKRYLAIIGIALFILILLQLDLNELLNTLAQTNLALFFLAGFLSIGSGTLKGLRWRYIAKAHEISLTKWEALKYFFIGFFISLFTPARLGELARAIYIKDKANGSISRALPTIVIDRLLDVAFLFLLAFLAVAGFAYLFGEVIIPFEILLALMLVFAAAAIFFLRKNAVGFVLKPFFNIMIPDKYKSKTQSSFNRFYESLARASKNPSLILKSFLLTFFAWAVSIFVTYILMLAVGITTAPFYYVIIILPIISLLDLLPISVSGLGTRDAALIGLLALYSVSPELSVAFSALILAAGYLFSFAFGAFLFTQEPISLDALKSSNAV